MSGFEPQWHCLDCGREWGRPHEEKPHYCSTCGSASSATFCSVCLNRINKDAERILAEASRIAEERARTRRVRVPLLVLILLLRTWGPRSWGGQTETIFYSGQGGHEWTTVA